MITPTTEQQSFLNTYGFTYNAFLDIYQSKKFNIMFLGKCLNEPMWRMYSVALITIMLENEKAMLVVKGC